ncbi:MAG: SDR family NAD(P)-dependent oxidoreductase, partial [Treponema sp.]|nr:SDR family NAD(P)-dependent oxidoreductase [Treponema sp.]
MNANELFNIKGKKAIVTGGTRGLGRGMAEGLLESGCDTVIIGSSDGVFKTADEFVKRGLNCTAVKADLGKRPENYSAFN